MQLDLTGRHVEITPVLRQLVTRRLARVERVLNDSLVSKQVVLSLKTFHHVVDITLHVRGDHLLRSAGDASSWQAALKIAVEKIVRQAERIKGKWVERRRPGSKTTAVAAKAPRAVTKAAGSRRTKKTARASAQMAPANAGARVMRPRRYAVKPMTVDSAARKVERGSDECLAFRNDATDSINIVYRRKDGRIGLIDLEP